MREGLVASDAVLESQFYEKERSLRYYSFFKRLFDMAIVILISPFALLLIGLLALAVRSDGNPAFYSQLRLGRDGRVFRMWKLRTMVPDAQALLERHLASDECLRAEWDRTQKLRNDPRITATGRILRKYSLDELPQLFNVLRGDMSLVGPRPMFPEQRDSYPGTAYFDMLPGLTGLWQVSKRNQCSFEERAVFDNSYAATRSFGLDIKILAITALVVFRGTGL